MKQNSFVLILQEKDRIQFSIYNLATNSFQWKDLKECYSPNFLFKVKAGACCLVSRHSASLGHNSSSNPKTRRVRDSLKCEPGKKEVQTPDVGLLSESRVYTRMREGVHPKKNGYWEPRVTNSLDNSPLCCIDGHPFIQKFLYTPWESSKEQNHFLTWEIILGLMNLYMSKEFLLLRILARRKIRNREAHEPWQKHHFIAEELMRNVPSWNTPDYFRMIFHSSWMVNYGSKLRKKEKNFDNICFESSKPTVEDHEYVSQDSNNRWNEGQTFWHASGNRCLHKSGKIPASSKAAAAAAATAAAILHRLHSRKKSFYIKKEILWDRIGDCYFWMTDVQKTLCWYSHLQVRMIRHHGESKRKMYTQSFDKKILVRCHTNWEESHFQYWEEDWERIYVWRLIALLPPQKFFFKKGLKSVKMQTKN